MVFFLFAGSQYYPSGGWNDYQAEFDTLEAAIEEVARNQGWDWAHIVEVSHGGARKRQVWIKGVD